MPELRADVAVVGAGPAGAASALALARQGYDVLLLDRARLPRIKTCGEYLSPGVAARLRALGAGAVLEGGDARQIPGMEIISPRGHILRVSYRKDGTVLPAYTLPRITLDAALVEMARKAGAGLLDSFVARTPIVEDGTVRGVMGTHRGDETTVRARVTIIADGARSVLVRQLGLARSVRWPDRTALVAYYAGTPDLRDGFGQMQVARGGYCGIAPLAYDRLNVAVVLPRHAIGQSGETATGRYERWIHEHPVLRSTLAGCRRVTSVRGLAPIGSRCVRSWEPGALIVGDASGFFDPFTGEGIYRALRGAEMAAAVCHRALSLGDVSSQVLGTYDEMRHRAFTWKQRTTALVQLFVQFPALMEYALPRLAARSLPGDRLSLVLGDVMDARHFLTPAVLWAALRP